MAETALRAPPPLPSTRDELLPLRRLKAKRTINDHVEDVVVRLWDDEEFQRLVDAIYDSQAVEGSMDVDDTIAAITIRDYAKKNRIAELADEKLESIRRAMRVVLRRYGQGRFERAERADGSTEPTTAPEATVQS